MPMRNAVLALLVMACGLLGGCSDADVICNAVAKADTEGRTTLARCKEKLEGREESELESCRLCVEGGGFGVEQCACVMQYGLMDR